VVRIAGRNWLQVEEYLAHDDRVVLPVGSTEQHAYLSLATDSILAERVAVEAAEPLGVLVLPAMPFGVAPGFAAFPGDRVAVDGDARRGCVGGARHALGVSPRY
jgi:creatinine amidohydrolase